MIRLLAIIAMMAVGSSGMIYGQHEVSGIVMDESLLPIVGAQVYIDDVRQPLATTGIDGRFNVNLLSLDDTLRVSFIGFETAEITLNEECDSLFIPIEEVGLYHYKSTRKVDRLRKKRFNELSSVHLAAYNAGIAKRPSPCYYRAFSSTKKELDQIKEKDRIVKRKQRKKYSALGIGDTIRLPFGTTYRYDGTDRTALHLYSMMVDSPQSECVVVFAVKKMRRKSTILKVVDDRSCTVKHPMFYDQKITEGVEIKVDIRYMQFDALSGINREE